mgnify:CR=1 FL=1
MTFLMLGKYTAEAIKGISSDRTQKARTAIENAGGKINALYALMGEHDLALIVEFPSLDDAVKASITLNKLTGIGFSTLPALPVEALDKLVD